MNRFGNEIIQLNNDSADYDFPEKFNNAIYFSEGTTPKDYSGFNYDSNFSFKYMVDGFESFMVEGVFKKIISTESLLINDGSETLFIGESGKAISIFIEPEILNDVHSTVIDQNKKLDCPFDNDCSNIELYDNPIRSRYSFTNTLELLFKAKASPVISNDFYFQIAKEILAMNSSIFSKLNSQSSVNLSTKKELFRRLEKAHQHILDNLSSNFDLDELSKVSCLSKYHLIRSFKQVYGTTPHKFYITKRIEAAKNFYLLNHRNETLKSTALEFGYPDYPSFSKQFKSIEGYTPSELTNILGN